MRQLNRTGRCMACGKALPAGSRSDKMTCGPTCGQRLRRALEKSGGKTYKCTCSWCYKKFTARSPKAAYCPGGACKQASYRKRRAVGAQQWF